MASLLPVLVGRGYTDRCLVQQCIKAIARRKLRMINNAQNINDLRIPPSNRHEKLKGNRRGSNSIRINRQWRIVFQWVNNNAEQVKIEDYHE